MNDTHETLETLETPETPETPEHDRPGFWAAGRHPVNVGHLVMGLAFLGLSAVWGLWGTDVIDDRDLRWLMAVPWIVAGAVGLVATTLAGARRRDRWSGARTDHGTDHRIHTDTTEEQS